MRQRLARQCRLECRIQGEMWALGDKSDGKTEPQRVFYLGCAAHLSHLHVSSQVTQPHQTPNELCRETAEFFHLMCT
jgi:hypothetical protein